jgi:hypothetical protein
VGVPLGGKLGLCQYFSQLSHLLGLCQPEAYSSLQAARQPYQLGLGTVPLFSLSIYLACMDGHLCPTCHFSLIPLSTSTDPVHSIP